MDEDDNSKSRIERVEMVKDIVRANYSPQQYIYIMYMPNAVMWRHLTSQQTPDAEPMLKKSTLAQHVLEVQTGNITNNYRRAYYYQSGNSDDTFYIERNIHTSCTDKGWCTI